MILVTGGAGFIGSNLVEELVRRGENVVVVDNYHTGSRENLRGVIEKIKLIEAPCSKLLELGLKVSKIFHLGIPSSSPMYRRNPILVGEAIADFMRVFELAKINGANVVYASTSSLYGMSPPPHHEDLPLVPFDFYTEARLAMERLAQVYHQLSGAPSVGLRFFSVYGPHEEA
ncbi:MAG: NAD-dependent epimerase/dehydratase family protein, partial [Candidatus Hadarchaeales archaeon]